MSYKKIQIIEEINLKITRVFNQSISFNN